jgi:hypothetical protein
MDVLIAKNNTDVVVKINSLGLVFQPYEEIILTGPEGSYDNSDIYGNEDLLSEVDFGNIVLNNGASDLSKEVGIYILNTVESRSSGVYAQLYNTYGYYDINKHTPKVIEFDGSDCFNDVYFSIVENKKIVFNRGGLYKIAYQLNWVVDNSSSSGKTIKSLIRVNGSNYFNRSLCFGHSYDKNNRDGTNSAEFIFIAQTGDYIELLCSKEGSSGDVFLLPESCWTILELIKEL